MIAGIMRMRMAMASLAWWCVASAQGQTMQATAAEAVQTFSGQNFILVREGNAPSIRLKRGQLGNLSGSCDVAVAARVARWENGRISFLLERLGQPQVVGGPGSVCSHPVDQITLEISGFSDADSGAAVKTALQQILQTPEEYLAERGVEFHLAPGPDDEELAQEPPALVRPVLLLRVEAAYSEMARKRRISGPVRISLVVGTDGRVHHAKVVQGLGSGLDEKALAVLPFWRFEPARQNGQAVAKHATVEMGFRIF